MADPIPPSLDLIPSPSELRHRLAVALHEVDLLRRLIRVAEHAAKNPPPGPVAPRQKEVAGAH